MTLGLVVGVLSVSLVLAGAIAAYTDEFFFVSQIRARRQQRGFPYVIHGGMWSDIVLICPLLTLIVAAYAGSWTLRDILCALVAGLIVSYGLHFASYVRTDFPTFMGFRGRLTMSGWCHLVFMGYALGVFALFYFATNTADHLFVVIVSFSLGAHVLISQSGQIFASIYAPDWFTDRPLRNPQMWAITLLTWLVLIWRCSTLLRLH
ncbi:MAG TPA: hypothetical protein VHU18_03465 [Rhizomicrobium sp.]|jgi:hypothetical protein|nr:hypothetical protein [Rhizomicrobium sp.]